MYIFFIIIIIIIIYLIWFKIRYSKALNDEEVLQLANGRRINSINKYYSFPKVEYEVDKNFKKNMYAKGRFYKTNENLYDIPAIVAGLLKYKKHEWIVVAFEKDQEVDLIWVNKGHDNKSVGLILDFNEIANMAKTSKYTSVIIFHNHPNANPSIYNCAKPSEVDLETADVWWNICKENGMNLIEYICERGISYRYFLKTTNEFYNIDLILKEIEKLNDKSSKENLELHRERMHLQSLRLKMTNEI